ncbi:MOSC domain containing protein [Cordyceps fumosorosea ARSEF 2679]|uniref:MOSC domain containing protein n=1 Tax=Cordyceps fumosorosea (strain ARSEF 2679) TaxID=1081104 RepID=A0A167UDG7_CORFA|nr:MOSC domain containing protein [Cordyceps fumosorosea ARSEF 2679]OAA61478.1 MOSC domain containing protein [Cordyceps fumosorosea ARSEF 2679]
MASLAEIASLLDVSSVFLFLVTFAVFSLPVLIIFPPIPVERSDALGQTHSKIGLPAARDGRPRDRCPPPLSPQATDDDDDSSPAPPRFIHPLTSCRGIELPDATELPGGNLDRVFCLAQRKTTASDSDWEALAPPRMADLQVDLWLPDPAKRSRQLGPMSAADDAFLVVRFPWRDPGLVRAAAAKLSRGSLSAAPEREFMLPLSLPSERERAARGYTRCGPVTLADGELVSAALDMGAELPAELAAYLGVEPGQLSLLRLDPERRRDQAEL